MLQSDEDEARPAKRIVDMNSGETVGFLYVWEDGFEQPLWFNGARKNVTLKELLKPNNPI